MGWLVGTVWASLRWLYSESWSTFLQINLTLETYPTHAGLSGAFSMTRRQARKLSCRLAHRNTEIFLSHAHIIDIALNASQCCICRDLATSSMLEARVHDHFQVKGCLLVAIFLARNAFVPAWNLSHLVTVVHAGNLPIWFIYVYCMYLYYMNVYEYIMNYDWMNSIFMCWPNFKWTVSAGSTKL